MYPGNTEVQLTNISDWYVLYLQVQQGAAIPAFRIYRPQLGSTAEEQLTAQVETDVFPAPNGGYYAVVPPGSTLVAESVQGSPVQLSIAVNYADTAELVTARGLLDVINARINPLRSEATAIAQCASYISSVPQLSQLQPGSPYFWTYVANSGTCYDAFHGLVDVVNGTEEATIAEGAESATKDFFEEILPKIASLVGEEVLG